MRLGDFISVNVAMKLHSIYIIIVLVRAVLGKPDLTI